MEIILEVLIWNLIKFLKTDERTKCIHEKSCLPWNLKVNCEFCLRKYCYLKIMIPKCTSIIVYLQYQFLYYAMDLLTSVRIFQNPFIYLMTSISGKCPLIEKQKSIAWLHRRFFNVTFEIKFPSASTIFPFETCV